MISLCVLDMAFLYISAVSDGTKTARQVRKVGDRMGDLHEALLKICMWCAPEPKQPGPQIGMLLKPRRDDSKPLDSAFICVNSFVERKVDSITCSF